MTGVLEALAISAAVSLATAGLTYALTPSQKLEGNRLNDLTSGNSTYGSPLPWAWGKVRLPGNKIWIDYLEEDKKTTKQGKGSKVSTTEYSYYGYYASVFCECPFRPIVDHDRIWMNKKLVFSRSGGAETITAGGKFAEQYLQFYKGAKNQLINPLLQNLSPISNYNYGLPADLIERDRFLRGLGLNPTQIALTPGYNQRAYLVATRLPLGDFFNSLPTDEAEIIASSNCTVGQIIADIFSLFFESDRYDTSLLTTPVQGFTIDSVQAAKQAVQLLQQAYFFDVVDSNGVFKFIPLNHSRPVINLDPKNLAANSASGQKPLDYEIIETDPATLPSQVSVQYIDPDLNYDVNTQTSQLEVKGHYNPNQVSITLPIVMSPTEAINIADRALTLAWIQKYLYKFQLPPYYLDLEPGDLVDNIFDDGAALKITQTRIGANLILDCQAVPHDTYFWNLVKTLDEGGLTVGIADYNVAIVTSGSVSTVTGNDGTLYTEGTDYVIDGSGNVQVLYTGTIQQGTEINIATTNQPTQSETDLGVIVSAGNTELLVLDIPLISDEDPDYTLYATAGGGANWDGASIYVSTDNSRYVFATTISTYGIYGTYLGTSNGKLLVQVNQPELESVTQSDLNLGFNLALIGNIIYQFRSAELVDVNTYRIPIIANQRRGTDGVRYPVIGDRFVLLTGTNARIVKIQGSISDLNQVRYFKAVSRGQTLAEVAPTTITIAGISQRPYRPKNLRATRDAVGNITITWQRRDRHGELIENPPLSEDFEQYVVQILSGTLPQTVVRSQTVNSSSYSYSTTDQTADFGEIQLSIILQIAQVSSSYGNGTFATVYLSPQIEEPAPSIASFSPASGAPGTTITLSGTSLATVNSVKINGVEQSNLAVINNETISFVIAPNTISDRITVTTTGGTATSAYAIIMT